MPTLRTILIYASWLSISLYIWSLPILAYAVQNFTDFKSFCLTPVESLQCSGEYPSSYKDAAAARGFFDKDLGCSCGQGLFGDAICPVKSPHGQDMHYCISYFIAAPQALGIMAVLSVPNIYFLVDYATSEATVLLRQTRNVFICFYALFLCFPVCIWKKTHDTVVAIFIIAAVIHVLVALQTKNELRRIPSFWRNGINVLVPLGIAYLAYESTTAWGIWAAECLAMTVSFGLSPLIDTLSTRREVTDNVRLNG